MKDFSRRELTGRLLALSEFRDPKGLSPASDAVWRTVCSEAARMLESEALPSEMAEKLPRAFEEKPVAWLIERPKGTGKQQTVELEVVLSPLTDDTYMDEGDCAYPLYRELHTQEQLDAATAEAKRLLKGIRLE